MAVQDVDMEQCIERCCALEDQPLSGRSLSAIVDFYSNGSYLVESMKRSQADQDFKTRFIEDHEAYIQLDGTSGSFLRVCHNLRDTEPYDELFLIVHGLGGNLEQFEPLMRLLDECGKNFLALDLPGFGKSDQWDRYSMGDVVEAIHQVRDQIAKPKSYKRLTIVGHSMGCYLSIHYYLKYHEDISKLVLLAPPKHNVDMLSKSRYWIQIGLSTGQRLPWLFDIYRERFDQCKGLKSSGIKQFFYREGDTTNCYRKLWQFHNNIQIKSRSIFGYFLGWEEIDWDKFNSALAQAGSRTSLDVICGEQDVVTPVQYSIDITKLLTGAENKNMIIVKDCGHNMCFDYPELFLKEFYQNIF